MNRLDHVVTNNLRNYKDQSNQAINSDPTFDTSSFNLSINTSNLLPVVTVFLQGGKKHRSTTVAGLECLRGIGSTNRMIKRRHTKHYERKMRCNKVEYSTADGFYCNAHYVKVPFCIP